jgi:acyl carrier protein
MTLTTDQPLVERMRELIARVLDVDPAQISDAQTLLCDDLGIDSLDVVELWMAVEAEFDIEINDDHDPTSLKTINDMVEFVRRTAAEQGVRLS